MIRLSALFSPDDPLCILNDPLESLPLCLVGVSVPDSDAHGEDTLHLIFTLDETQDCCVGSILDEDGVVLGGHSALG